MATITQLPSKKWQAKIRMKGLRKSKTFPTKAKAQRWAKALEVEHDSLGNDSALIRAKNLADAMTLGSALIRYRDEVSVKKAGHRQEACKIGIMLDLPICNKPMSSITPDDIRHLMDVDLATGRGVAPSTIQKYMAIISHTFNTARTKWGMNTLDNPYSVTDKPIIDNARERRFEGDEYQYLMDAMSQDWKNKNPYLLPLVLFLLETTQRVGEALDQKWKDVDIEKRKMKSKNKDTSKAQNNTIKYIPLSSRALAIFADLKKMPDYDPNGYVFPATYDAVQQAFSKACMRACEHAKDYKPGSHSSCGCPGIQDFHIHDLRHEAISRLFENTTLRTEQIMKITGHKTYAMIQRYLHLRETDELADALG